MVSMVRAWMRAHVGALLVGAVFAIGGGALIVGCGLNSGGGGGGGSPPPLVITLVKSSGDGQTGTAGTALPLPLVAQAVDQSNQPVPNQPIVWTVTNGFLTNTIAVTDTGGFTQTTLTCGLKPGPVTATAATGSASVTFTATAGALPAVKLALTGFPSPVKLSTPGTITVTALDINGNTATGYKGTIKFTSSDLSATLPANYTFTAADAGVHMFSVTLASCGAQSITATDTVTATITGTQFGIVVTGGKATKFLVTGFATPTNSGAPFDLLVSAVDASGCVDPTYTGTVKITSSDVAPGVVLPATYTFVGADAGVHKFPVGVVLQTAGSQTVTATDTVTGLTGSGTVTVATAVRVTSLTSAPSVGQVTTGTVAVSWTGTGLGAPTAVSLTGTNQPTKAEPNGSPATDTPAQTGANSPFPTPPKFIDPYAFYRLSATNAGMGFPTQMPEITQATQVGAGTGATANAVAGFTDGTYVVTGFFTGSATFGQPNQGGPTLLSFGGADVFVARYSAKGALLWAVQGGGTGDDAGNGVAACLDGTCIVTGTFTGSATFGAKILTSTGAKDIFVVRYKTDGTVQWAVSAGGASDDIATAIGAFGDGSSTVAGHYSGTMTFTASKSLTSVGAKDIFVAHYAPDGTFSWAKSAGGPLDDFALGVAATPDGRSVVTGSFSGAATFGALPAVTSGAGGTNADAFVAGYAADGKELWVNQIQSAVAGISNKGLGVATFRDGSVAVTGAFGGTATFIGAGATVSSAGGTDMFLARYSSAGVLIPGTAKSGGGASDDEGTAVAALPDGSVVVTGSYSGPASFSGAPLAALGGKDAFVCRYDSTDTLVWARSSGGTSDDQGLGAASLIDGSAVIVGVFSSATMTLGPGVSLTDVGGATNAFVFVSAPINYRMLEVRPTGFSGVTVSTGGGIFSPRGCATFPDGGSVVVGFYEASVSVTLAAGVTLPATPSIASGWWCPASNYESLFVVRCDSTGTAVWAAWATLPTPGFATGDDFVFGQGVAAFPDGGFIVSGTLSLNTGSASKSVDFVSAGGATGVTVTGGTGFFISKYSASGTCTSATFFSGFPTGYAGPAPSSASANALGSDDCVEIHVGGDPSLLPTSYKVCAFTDGTYAVSGRYTAAFTFTGGKSLPKALGTTDMFVAHFTAADVNDWVATGGSATYVTQATGIASCTDGSTIVAGTFNNTTTVGGGYSVVFGTKTLTDPTTTTIPTDAFIIKYDKTGVITWATNSVTGSTTVSTTCVPSGIDAFADGTCVIAGSIGTGAQKFGATTLTPGAATTNPFVATFDLTGKLAPYGLLLSSTAASGANDVAVYRDGSVVIAGSYGPATLSCGSGVTLGAPAAGTAAMFIARYKSDGTCLWAKNATVSSGAAGGLAIAGSDDLSVTVSGMYTGPLTIGSGDASAVTIAASGTQPVFFARYFNY